jgi:hypothetical protein
MRESNVALVRVGSEYPPEIAVRGGGIFAGEWYVGGPRFGSQHGWHEDRIEVIRPLVVIDPEDREQVERLARDHHASGHIAAWGAMHENTRAGLVDEMQAALREFANPKPPCGASLTLGKAGALYRCSEVEGHDGPHLDGTCTWTAKS